MGPRRGERSGYRPSVGGSRRSRREGDPHRPSGCGGVRILLEGKYLFDVLDKESDFSRYKVLILPDAVVVEEPLRAKLEAFLSQGGKLLATGQSGIDSANGTYVLPLGIRWLGENPYRPDYYRPLEGGTGPFKDAAFIMYGPGQRIELLEEAESWGAEKTLILTATCSPSAPISIRRAAAVPVVPAWSKASRGSISHGTYLPTTPRKAAWF
ncbi:beta-galactosidase trimerization domain-containing protein [Paenibacillus sp. CC-CFT747]|nr:beta-galactosidase trimerization domain-containing protein [Paenibacillus sp. CC-CFT747]